jgi:hypothetical protein
LEVKASFRHRWEGGGVFWASAWTHARLGENAAKAQADLAELKAAQARGPLLDAEAVERERPDVLGTVRAGMLAVPSRAGARLPHLTGSRSSRSIAVRAVLSEIGNDA